MIKPALLLSIIVLAAPSVSAAKPISFHADFEDGALGQIERVSDAHFRCGVKGESDQDGRNRQANWYHRVQDKEFSTANERESTRR